MFLSFTHYPEIKSHAKPNELIRLFKQQKHTPPLLWVMHVLAVIVIGYVPIEVLWQRFTLLACYFVLVYFLGVNVWYRAQFLAKLPKLSEQALACPIASLQTSLKQLWDSVDAYSKLELTLLSQPLQVPLDYGYLSLVNGDTQAPIKLNTFAHGNKHVSVLLAQEQILPFVLSEGTQVSLQLGGMPLNAIITKLARVADYQIEEPLLLSREQTLHVFRFAQPPRSLMVETTAKAFNRTTTFALRLVHIDSNNRVGYALQNNAFSDLIVGDEVQFENGERATLVNVIQPFHSLRYQ